MAVPQTMRSRKHSNTVWVELYRSASRCKKATGAGMLLHEPGNRILEPPGVKTNVLAHFGQVAQGERALFVASSPVFRKPLERIEAVNLSRDQ